MTNKNYKPCINCGGESGHSKDCYMHESPTSLRDGVKEECKHLKVSRTDTSTFNFFCDKCGQEVTPKDNHLVHPSSVVAAEKLHALQSQPKSEDVELEDETTLIGQFQKERTDALSEMFENKYADGIYPTSKLFSQLDTCVRNLLSIQRKQVIEEAIEKISKLIVYKWKKNDVETECPKLSKEDVEQALKALIK